MSEIEKLMQCMEKDIKVIEGSLIFIKKNLEELSKFNLTNVNVVDQNLLEDFLVSPQGDRILVNAIRRNITQTNKIEPPAPKENVYECICAECIKKFVLNGIPDGCNSLTCPSCRNTFRIGSIFCTKCRHGTSACNFRHHEPCICGNNRWFIKQLR